MTDFSELFDQPAGPAAAPYCCEANMYLYIQLQFYVNKIPRID